MSPVVGFSIVIGGLLIFAVSVAAMGWWSDHH
jgi:hypothetical protein